MSYQQTFVLSLLMFTFFGLRDLPSTTVNQRLSAQTPSQSQQAEPIQTNSVVIELFYRGDSQRSLDALEYIKRLHSSRNGLEIKHYDVLENRAQLKRLWQLAKESGYEKPLVPAFYLCSTLKFGFESAEVSGPKVESLLTVRAYVRPGCKRCKAGKQFLNDMQKRWPALKVQYFDVDAHIGNLEAARHLFAKHKVTVPSFPCIEVAGRLVVGFQSEEITGRQIEDLFRDRSRDLKNQSKEPAPSPGNDNLPSKQESGAVLRVGFSELSALYAVSSLGYQENKRELDPSDEEIQNRDSTDADEFDDESWGVPEEATDQPLAQPESSLEKSDEIEVPVFGRLSVKRLGLPLFTFLVGLVDGFNPCAMWVLIFLLSVLVNIKERKKILLVAGTFILVSGLAYFVFMTAYFNVFQLIGYMRPVQIVLGIVAIIIGSINIKDFFAFQKGITLSIPKAAKPGIYRRVREIVSANHLTTALSGAVVLAVIVNVVELLCTAGLPALYSQILSMQNLSTAANYGYLALYIAAYMLDDSILVGIVLVTLSNRRLQENEGRWLKLLSGVVILLLGVVMLFWPDALV